MDDVVSRFRGFLMDYFKQPVSRAEVYGSRNILCFLISFVPLLAGKSKYYFLPKGVCETYMVMTHRGIPRKFIHTKVIINGGQIKKAHIYIPKLVPRRHFALNAKPPSQWLPYK